MALKKWGNPWENDGKSRENGENYGKSM